MPRRTNEEQRQYRRDNYDKVKIIERRVKLKYKYKMSLEDYAELLETQNGVCAICKRTCVARANLAVDHDRKCCPGQKTCGNCISGLLCQGCNTSLGKMNDNVQYLKNAIDYLECANA